MQTARTRFLAAAASAGTIALSAIVPVPTAASPASHGAGTAVGANPVSTTVHGAAGRQAVLDYWTPARMRSARPGATTATGSGAAVATLANAAAPAGRPAASGPSAATAPTGNQLEHTTRVLSARAVARYPSASVGKVFFTLDGFDFFCSASAVSSAGRWGEGSRQLVLTAGHCVNDGDGVFASKFEFVPGYHDGIAPEGRWVATQLITTEAWNTGLGLAFSRDVAFAVVTGTGEYAGTKLDDVVRPIPVAFQRRYPKDRLYVGVAAKLGTKYSAYGYPVSGFGGQSQVRNVSRVDRFDTAYSPSPVGAPSAMTGGSSGGPWLYSLGRYGLDSHCRYRLYSYGHHRLYSHCDTSRYSHGRGRIDSIGNDRLYAIGNYHYVVNGVDSYEYNGVERMYSPQFDDAIHRLWAFASTASVACTDGTHQPAGVACAPVPGPAATGTA